MNFLTPLWGAAALAALMFWMAWREHAQDNTRDAGLLLGIGTTTGLATGAFWLFS